MIKSDNDYREKNVNAHYCGQLIGVEKDLLVIKLQTM